MDYEKLNFRKWLECDCIGKCDCKTTTIDSDKKSRTKRAQITKKIKPHVRMAQAYT